MKEKMTRADDRGSRLIGLFLLFGSSIVLALGISTYLVNQSYLTFLITFTIWIIGTLLSIKFFKKDTAKQFNEMDRIRS